MNQQIPDNISQDAVKACAAAHNGDWSLHAHISRRYRFGTEERRLFEAAKKQVADEYLEAQRCQSYSS